MALSGTGKTASRGSPLLRTFLLLLLGPNSAADPFLLVQEADPRRCAEDFDPALKRQCMRGDWEQRFYFDRESGQCRLFWYDGCPSASGSRNFFDSLLSCQWLCEPGDHGTQAICLEPFDEHLRDECDGAGNWRRRHYFDRAKRRCVPFWYDGCQSSAGNMFEDELSCARSCEAALPPDSAAGSEAALGPATSTQLVPAWRAAAASGSTQSTATVAQPRPEQHFYTRPEVQVSPRKQWPQVTVTRPEPQLAASPSTPSRRASPAPIHSARGGPAATSPTPHSPSATTQLQQSSSAQQSEGILQRHSHSPPHRAHHHRPVSAATTPRPDNVCQRANPCRNNGTCLFDPVMRQPICRCAPGFTNDLCTERIEFDPCALEPCKNGATCSAKAGPERTEFDCFCARGYAGGHCDLRPCDENPCKNGGTCRTTRSPSLFFCACAPGWGGQTCLISIPPSDDQQEPQLENVNFTQQLSSGKAEWIQALRKITPTTPVSMTTGEDDEIGSDSGSNPAYMIDSSPDGEDSGEFSSHRASSRRSKDQSTHGFSSERIVGEENPTRTLKATTKGDYQHGPNGAEGQRRCQTEVLALATVVAVLGTLWCRTVAP